MPAAAPPEWKPPEPPSEKPSLRENLKATFDSFDADHSGSVSTEEITEMLQSLGVKSDPEQITSIVKAADTDGNGEIDFEEFYAAMASSDFAEMIIAASHPADVARSLEEANAHFLTSFDAFVLDTLESCQREVLAAKVPLTSYGRVKSALDTVKVHLTGTARALLTEEFANIRKTALDSLNVQRTQLDKLHDKDAKTTIDKITNELTSRAEAAETRLADVEAEVARLRDRSNKPEVFISSLESQLAEKEKQLKAATDEATRIAARLKAYDDDWRAKYPGASAAPTRRDICPAPGTKVRLRERAPLNPSQAVPFASSGCAHACPSSG